MYKSVADSELLLKGQSHHPVIKFSSDTDLIRVLYIQYRLNTLFCHRKYDNGFDILPIRRTGKFESLLVRYPL